MSLLIVDDDAPIRKLLERVAVRAGFEVDCAKDGIDALEKMQTKQYGIAIVDLMMPRMSGYDLVQKISTMNPRPLVIVATAMTNSDLSKIDDTLVRGVIRKPFDVTVVADALVETARQIPEQPGAPMLRVSAEDLVKEISEEQKKPGEEKDGQPMTDSKSQ